MKRRQLRVLAGIAVFAAALGLNPPPTSATSAAAVAGGGTISPGLTTTPTDQHVSFSGSAIGVMDTKAGTCTLTFDTDSNDETIQVGTGSGFGYCSGTSVLGESIGFSCSVSYTRAGVVAVITGACYGRSMAGVLIVEATSALPIKSFLAQGAVAVTTV